MMLPLVARATQEVLLLVPGTLREASLALGVSRWRTVLGVILPTTFGGILTGAVLAVARAAGETAPLLFTSSIFNHCGVDRREPRAAEHPGVDLHLLRAAGPGAPRAGMGCGTRADGLRSDCQPHCESSTRRTRGGSWDDDERRRYDSGRRGARRDRSGAPGAPARAARGCLRHQRSDCVLRPHHGDQRTSTSRSTATSSPR